ncbi:MAG: winged helix-turn-helix transcriptional regulator [Pseudomonadales bacterium]|nr:winged helix-turn-helix transcriptional regulator [Pseudomonadales bacterium]
MSTYTNRSDLLAPESLLAYILDTASGLEREMDRALSNTRGITFREYRLVSVIAAAGSTGLPRIDLAHAVGLTASAVTRALRPLEKLGYLETARGERDAGESLAKITKGGTELLSDAQKILNEQLAGLPIEEIGDARLSTFTEVLHLLAARR